tara:strand:- start:45 stop:572 length:528 start_codon:yes stop_codon:yes gene_type:complete
MSSILKVDQLQDSGGNAIITSDGSGNITTQKLLYPAFEAHIAADQTIPNATYTTPSTGTVIYDTDSAFSTSTYTFTPQVAGKYLCYAQIRFRGTVVNILNNLIIAIKKNGTRTRTSVMYAGSNDEQFTMQTQGIFDLNGSTDNLSYEGYAAVSSGSPYFEQGGKGTFFGAYRIGD